MTEEKAAVASGYWHNFRFDPRLAADGKNPFSLDSKEPSQSYRDFIMNEVRYNSLLRAFPDRAECLFEKSEEYSKEKYQHLLKLKDLYARLNKCRRASKNTVRVLRRLSVKHCAFFGDSMCP